MLKQLLAATAAATFMTPLLAQAPCYETNLGTNLGLTADDGGTAVALGFTFPFAGTPYTDINICTNGFVWLGATPPTTSPWDWSPSETELLSGPARVCPLWMDLYLPAGGNVFFNTFPAAPGVPARAVVTWDQVPWISNNQVLMTIQLQLLDDGSMHWSVAATGGAPNTTELIGFTQGNGATANPIDFSSLPANSGNFPTAYEVFTSPNAVDILGQSFQALPNGSNGYMLLTVPQCRLAGAAVYGAGCPAPSATVAYEQFNTGLFDLANMSLMFVPNANGSYTILPGTNVWFGGFTNNLTLGDDTTGSVTLPFSFPHAGGSTSAISVSSNGFLWLGTNTNAACCNGDHVAFCSDPMARIAACWMDLYPPGGGGVYADFDTATGEYVVTWSAVPEYQTNPPVTMQIALQASGIFEIRYQALTNTSHTALVGYSIGACADPGGYDLSNVSTTPIVTGTFAQPLALAMQAGSLPHIGTTCTEEISGYTANTQLAVLILSLLQANIDLTPFGMAGCTAHVDFLTPGLSSKVFLPVLGPQVSVPLTIPNSPSLVGMNVYTQAAALAPGVTALGLIVSNGLTLMVGH